VPRRSGARGARAAGVTAGGGAAALRPRAAGRAGARERRRDGRARSAARRLRPGAHRRRRPGALGAPRPRRRGGCPAPRRERAAPATLRRLLVRGGAVIACPESNHPKPFRARYRLGRFGRGAFARVAIATGTPIVPVAVIGAEEVHPVLARLDLPGRLLGLPT